MKKADDLNALHHLAEIARDAELAKMRKVIAHMNRLQAEIAGLNASRAARAQDRDLDASRLSGADVRWMAWNEGELRRLQAQLAAVRVNHEVMLASAKKAFGKADVMGQMVKAEAQERQLEARRKS